MGIFKRKGKLLKKKGKDDPNNVINKKTYRSEVIYQDMLDDHDLLIYGSVYGTRLQMQKIMRICFRISFDNTLSTDDRVEFIQCVILNGINLCNVATTKYESLYDNDMIFEGSYYQFIQLINQCKVVNKYNPSDKNCILEEMERLVCAADINTLDEIEYAGAIDPLTIGSTEYYPEFNSWDYDKIAGRLYYLNKYTAGYIQHANFTVVSTDQYKKYFILYADNYVLLNNCVFISISVAKLAHLNKLIDSELLDNVFESEEMKRIANISTCNYAEEDLEMIATEKLQ